MHTHVCELHSSMLACGCGHVRRHAVSAARGRRTRADGRGAAGGPAPGSRHPPPSGTHWSRASREVAESTPAESLSTLQSRRHTDRERQRDCVCVCVCVRESAEPEQSLALCVKALGLRITHCIVMPGTWNMVYWY